jgi:hypothetical protein
MPEMQDAEKPANRPLTDILSFAAFSKSSASMLPYAAL